MKAKFYTISIITLIFEVFNANAQTNTFPSTGSAGIGTTSPDVSSALEIKSTTQGLLISRMTQTQRNAIVSPAVGLMIYQTTNTPGFYYYDGSWKPVTPKSKGWQLTGNSGTVDGLNFIGTTDNVPLNFRVNNVNAGRIDPATNNVFFGINAGTNTTGQNNTLIGSVAGYSNTTGQSNTAVGSSALFYNTTGQYNTALGASALTTNNGGSYNTATGYNALRLNTSGANNAAGGFAALNANSTGNLNTAFGYRSLFSNKTASSNVAVGGNALYTNTTGSDNTACGTYALNGNTTGNSNTATGYLALYANTTGSSNTALGYRALASNTVGHSNVAIGVRALFSNIFGSNSVAIGDSALYHCNTGTLPPFNTAIGSKALYSTTTGTFNTATGYQALYANMTGERNTANGWKALYANTTAHKNTATGYQALWSTTTGGGNTGMGADALIGNTTGSLNVAVGSAALYENSTGYGNTAVGTGAGSKNDNNAYCSFFGYDAFQDGTVDLYNSTALGWAARIFDDDQVRIGNAGVTSIGGYVGWSNVSDGRYKKNIQENVPGLKFINALRPITYHLDISGIGDFLGEHSGHAETMEETSKRKSVYDESVRRKEQVLYTGFIAQEVEAVAKKLNYDFSGIDKPGNQNGLYGLRYAEFVVPLVKAVQELSKMNEEKDDKLAELKTQNIAQKKINADLQKQIDDLKEMIKAANSSANAGDPATINTQLSSASLQQNIPNPFNHTTTINYTLPQTFSSARIVVTDKAGKVLQSINLSASGKGSLTLDAPMLSSGAYQYSLYVNGRLIDTKQMVLAK